MTNTLDLPQHGFVCGACGRIVGQLPGSCDDGSHVDRWGPRTAPTLTFRDFEAFMLQVWDRLESHTDTSETNREAIDAAIRAVGRERQARCGATFADAADEPVCCDLPAGHDGRHYDRGFTWVPDWRAVGREGTGR